MKKIISLLSVFAMVLTMLSTVALADDANKVYWEDITPEGATTVTLKLVAETSYTLDKLQASYDLASANSTGVKYTATDLAGCTVFNNGAKSPYVLSFTYTNLSGFTGKVEICTLELDFSEATVTSLTIPQKKAMSATNGTTKYQSYFTNAAAGYVVNAPVTKTLSSIALASTSIAVKGGAEVTLPAVTAIYSDDSTAPVTATWTNAAGETITSFTAPEATTEVQTVVLTASYTEGDVTKTATYTVTVNAKAFTATATAGDTLYYSEDAATVKYEIKTFDCTVENCADGIVTITFTDGEKDLEYPEFDLGVTGGATAVFKALLLNAPASVTMTIAD